MQLKSKLFYIYVCFVLLYLASFLAPRAISNVAVSELSTLQYRLLSMTVAIPLCVIWFAAFYGYVKLKAYADMVRNTPDGRHVMKLAAGILILAIGLPVSSLAGSAVSIVGQQAPDWTPFTVIVKNYVALLFPLASFIFISKGARGLSEITKQRPTYRAVNIMTVLFIAIGISYCAVIFNSTAIPTAYHLPTWLVMVSLVGPYLYMWFTGVLAAYELYLYSRKAPGKLYRKTWSLLAGGLGGIILMQVAVQYLTIMTASTTQMKLLRLLVIVYVLLLGLAVSYMMVAAGSKRLQKIEEV